MLEMLLTSGDSNYYPNSGPGSKKLIVGDKNLGFFGLVTEEEMNGISDTLYELASAAVPTKSPARYKNLRWSKMFFREKVYFYPEKPIAYGFVVDDIIRAKMFRGDDKSFLVTFGTQGTAPVQDQRVVVNENSRKWKLIPRLLRSDRTANSEFTNEVGSETALLLNTIHGVLSNSVTRHASFKSIPFLSEEGTYTVGSAAVKYMTSELGVDYVTSAGTNQLNAPFSVIMNAAGTVQNLVANFAADGISTAFYWRPVLVLEGAADANYSYLLPISGVLTTVNIDMLPQSISYLTAAGLSRIVLNPITTSGTLLPQGTYSFDSPAFRVRAANVKMMYAITPAAMNSISYGIGLVGVKKIVGDYLPHNAVTSQRANLIKVSGIKETEPLPLNTQGESVGEAIRPYLFPQNNTSVVTKATGYEQTDARYYRAYMLESVSSTVDTKAYGSTNMEVRYYRAFMNESVSSTMQKATGYGRVN